MSLAAGAGCGPMTRSGSNQFPPSFACWGPLPRSREKPGGVHMTIHHWTTLFQWGRSCHTHPPPSAGQSPTFIGRGRSLDPLDAGRELDQIMGLRQKGGLTHLAPSPLLAPPSHLHQIAAEFPPAEASDCQPTGDGALRFGKEAGPSGQHE